MAQRQLPGLGLTGFWDLGYRPWKDENDANLRIISALLGMQALDLVAVTPGAPVDGQIYLFSAAHPTQPNKVAIRDVAAWIYVTPLTGAIMYDVAAGFHRKFDGAAWVAFASGGGGLPVGGGGLPVGGATSTLLAKASATDYDANWLFLVDTDNTLAADSDARLATQKAVKAYVATMVTGLLDFKGLTNCSANPNYPAALKGDAYLVSVSGKIGGAAGAVVEVGDVYIAAADNAGGTQVAVGASWFILEHNISGSGVGLPVGGTAGQVLTKNSATDYDASWVTPPIVIRPIGFFFTTAPTASETLLLYTAIESITLADEFAGSAGDVGTNPAASFVLDVLKNGTSIGSITISTAGVFSFVTAGATVDLVPGDQVKIIAPAVADTTINNVSITLKGAL